MENIFKNAKFGDCFKTRDGRKAIYLGYKDSYHIISPQDYNGIIVYKDDGLVCESEEQNLDIISERHEEINEEELEKLAEEYAEQFDFVDSTVKYACKKDFKAGYRKAKKGE